MCSEPEQGCKHISAIEEYSAVGVKGTTSRDVIALGWVPWNYRETLARLATPTTAQHDEPAWPKGIASGQGWSDVSVSVGKLHVRRRQNRVGFLARHEDQRKRSAPASLPRIVVGSKKILLITAQHLCSLTWLSTR
jgi:hypothetical protein